MIGCPNNLCWGLTAMVLWAVFLLRLLRKAHSRIEPRTESVRATGTQEPPRTHCTSPPRTTMCSKSSACSNPADLMPTPRMRLASHPCSWLSFRSGVCLDIRQARRWPKLSSIFWPKAPIPTFLSCMGGTSLYGAALCGLRRKHGPGSHVDKGRRQPECERLAGLFAPAFSRPLRFSAEL